MPYAARKAAHHTSRARRALRATCCRRLAPRRRAGTDALRNTPRNLDSPAG